MKEKTLRIRNVQNVTVSKLPGASLHNHMKIPENRIPELINSRVKPFLPYYYPGKVLEDLLKGIILIQVNFK